MRNLTFSLACTLGLVACGVRPESPRVAESHSEPASAPAELALLTVADKVTLTPPSRPLGRALRLASTMQGELYLLDSDNHRVLRYGQGGELLGEAGGLGSGTRQFSSPVDLDADGQTVWILDRQNRRLVRLNRLLNVVEEVPLSPSTDRLAAPLWYDAVSTAANGDVFLLDRRGPEAIRISPAGEILASYGGFGTGNGRLEEPTDIDATQDGSLFVVDGRRLLVFDRSGNLSREVRHVESLARVEAAARDAWLTTSSGELLWYSDGRLHRVTAVRERLPRPTDLTLLAGKDPLLLDGSSVWLCRTTED